MLQKHVRAWQPLTGQCVAHLQGLPGSLPETAEAARRRRKLLVRNDNHGYTPGAGFDMSALQVPIMISCVPPRYVTGMCEVLGE